MTPTIKPWPSDAVIVVAPRDGEALISPEHPCEIALCRDCITKVIVRTQSINAAEQMLERMDRPVDFLCVQCALKYDVQGINILLDLRNSKENHHAATSRLHGPDAPVL